MTQTNRSTRSRQALRTEEASLTGMVEDDENARPSSNAGRSKTARGGPELQLIDAEPRQPADSTASTELEILNHSARVMPVNDDDI